MFFKNYAVTGKFIIIKQKDPLIGPFCFVNSLFLYIVLKPLEFLVLD